MGHLKTFAKGVALGGLVGVVYGFFTAPKKGSEMQKEAKLNIKKLAKKGKSLQRKIEPKVKKAIKKVEKSARGGSALGRKAIKKGKTIIKKNNKRKKK
jgi:gas vesicle protein